MKLTLSVFLSVLLIPFVHGNSAPPVTYTITSNSSWTTLVGSSCSNCIFNITPGITFTLDKNSGSCSTCTFTGGTVNITQNFSFNANVSFSSDTLLMNGATTFQGSTFSSDSIAVNQAATFYTGTTFTGDRMSINAATTCQTCTFTDANIHMDNQAMTLQSGVNTFTNTNFALSGTSSITSTKGIAITNSIFSFSNSSYLFNNGGTLTASGSSIFLNGSSHIEANSSIVLKNSSELFIGDGTLASTAYLLYNAGQKLNIIDNSLIKVSNGNNSYQNNSAYTYTSSGGANTNYNTASNSISCGSGHPHACTTNYVYGCATLNSGGALGCIALAIADIDLSATATGTGAVALSWSYGSNNNADHFQVQRSTNSQDWTTIATVTANGYALSDYYFNDPDVSPGVNDYRIQVVDKNGSTLYSKISVITIAQTPTAVSVYPNPIAGRIFYIRTASTSPLLLNVFTLSGQLLFRTSLKGQTLYPVNLPASVTPGTCLIAQVIDEEAAKAFNLLSR